jgi:hypothetical protein
MPYEQRRLVTAVAQQGAFLRGAERCRGNLLGQGVGLKHDISIGLRVVFPELGAEERPGHAVAAGQGQAARQAHVGAAQQAVKGVGGETVTDRRRLDKSLVNAASRVLRAQRIDNPAVPAGVHRAEPSGIQEQRHLVEPIEEIFPVMGMLLELAQGLANQAQVARGVLAHESLAAGGRRRGDPAQRIEFVVAHDALRLTCADHVVYQVQGLANVRAAVDEVAQEQGQARGVAPHATLLSIAQGVEQILKCMGAPVHVADQIVTSRRIKHQSPPPPSRLPQPSLVRQTS